MKSPLIFFACVLLFVACKKYPENNLWFKNPEKIKIFDYSKIKSYRVNGIDSLQAMNAYVDQSILNQKSQMHYWFRVEDGVFMKDLQNYVFGQSLAFASNIFDFEFTKDKKKIKVDFKPSPVFNKNLFISPSVEWTIVRLSKSADLTLETVLENGNTYRIEMERNPPPEY